MQSRKCVVTVRPMTRRTTTPAKMTMDLTSSMATLPTLPLSADMAVTFPAYLAVFLGTLIPCAFLIILYIQAESRKAGERSARDE